MIDRALRGEVRWRRALVLALLSAAIVVVGCVQVPASPSPSAGSAADSSAPSPSEAPPATPPSPSPSPTPSGPLGGGLLAITQIDHEDPDQISEASFFTLDATTGERMELGSMEVTPDTCCPGNLTWSKDRARVFVLDLNYRGYIDVGSRELLRRPRGIQRFNVAPSTAGDRIAWIDEETGTAPTIVLTNLEGEELDRLELPPGTVYPHMIGWSADDRTILVHVEITFATAMIGGGLFAMCCSIDPGPRAEHILRIPVDGSEIVDLATNERRVLADIADSEPAPEVLGIPDAKPGVELDMAVAAASPDGRFLAYRESACWTNDAPSYRTRKVGCIETLLVLDETGEERVLAIPPNTPIVQIRWAPDGERLAFWTEAMSNEEGEMPEGKLFVFDLEDAAPRQVAEDVRDVVGWSPDGEWLAFRTSTKFQIPDLRIVRTDGTDERVIAERASGGW